MLTLIHKPFIVRKAQDVERFTVLKRGTRAESGASDVTLWKRAVAATLVVPVAGSSFFCTPVSAASPDLTPFQSSKSGYHLERPTDWEQVDKAGADALFKAPALKSTDLGITVSPIRIKELAQLGDLTAVGDKLLKTEKAKESNKATELLGQTSRTGDSGTKFYEYDYTVSTTRGDKRILSSVAVSKNKLYIVNGNIRCEGERCKQDDSLVDQVRRSIRSFDVTVQ